MFKPSTWWWYSTLISSVLIFILIILWIDMNKHVIPSTQLVNAQAVEDFLAENWEKNRDNDASILNPTIKIKTGLFIQSLQFSNSTEVSVTGYIWQKYEQGQLAQTQLNEGEVGFIFPEQVNSGSDINPVEVYRIKGIQDNSELIGWYFEVTLRQPFDYSKYPFDHSTVWIRMWHKNFHENIILVPDFDSYNATGITDIFAIEQDIVLGTWERFNTYFDYKLSSYDTNFGIENYLGQSGFPELHYNFVLKRKFENAFIVYLLPLFLVAVLLFAALLTVNGNDELSDKLGFNTTGFIGGCSALFFVVMLAHIQLRQEFVGASIVYIEYFYILMYGFLVAATANTYLFSIGASKWSKVIVYKDNIIPKIAYWPLFISCLILITLWVNK